MPFLMHSEAVLMCSHWNESFITNLLACVYWHVLWKQVAVYMLVWSVCWGGRTGMWKLIDVMANKPRGYLCSKHSLLTPLKSP